MTNEEKQVCNAVDCDATLKPGEFCFCAMCDYDITCMQATSEAMEKAYKKTRESK